MPIATASRIARADGIEGGCRRLEHSYPLRPDETAAAGGDPHPLVSEKISRRVQARPPPAAHLGSEALGPQEKKPINWRLWITGILIALVVVVCLQNSQKVSVEVLFASFDAPLIIVLAAFTLIGMLIGYIGPVYRRHRREEKRAGQELEKKD